MAYDTETPEEEQGEGMYEEQETETHAADPLSQLRNFIQSKNLCEYYEEYLPSIGAKIVEYYIEDDDSRIPWKNRYYDWLKLATQVMEKKTYPWPDAANVKYPLLTTAAMQFAARAYPALVPGPNLVQGLVIGEDQQGLKQAAAKRVGAHMSYQLLYQMEGWEEDMDRLCMTLPICGCMFKKIYYDPMKEQNCSELVMPTDLVVDYFAKSLETASRIHHVIWLTRNEVEARIRKGIFKDIELGLPKTVSDSEGTDARQKIDGTTEPKITPATPHKFIECHCEWDLDDDGYDEPYIITVHADTRQVVRIVTRFDADDIKTEIDDKTGKEKLICIEAENYFCKFGFIPNPDGSIYSLGFGLLLGGLNEAINTLTNQLLDSGTLHNLQAGFLGRGIRVRAGGSRFVPGEWKPVEFTGDDIKKHIFPLPTKEPSEVLFKLLEALVTSGKELASVAEIFVGKMPGQNTPATTTMATIEQGLKVFTAIHKRIYRSLTKEYERLYHLNSEHLPDQKIYFTINEPQGPTSQSVSKQDYAMELSVKPSADPNVVSSAQKLMKVQSYGSLLQLGTISPQEYTKRYLEAVEAENIGVLMQVGQQPPSPDQQLAQEKTKQMQMDSQIKQQEAAQNAEATALQTQADQKSADLNARIKLMEASMKEREASMSQMHTQALNAQKLTHQQELHNQKLTHANEMHMMKKQHAKEMAMAKPKGGTK